MLTSVDCMVTVQSGEPPLIVVVGEVNYESAQDIKQAFEELLRDGASRIVMDCNSVDFVDSSGIGAIVDWAKKLKKAGGELTLRSATRQLVHALRISGFSDQMIIEPTEADFVEEVMPKLCVNGLRQQARFSIPLPADRDGLIRKRVTELAESMPFTKWQIDDIRLAVGEAVSNAIRHGCSGGEHDRLNVDCTGDDEKLVIKVNYPGGKFDPKAVPIPDPNNPREGGMGIFFMRSAMDMVDYSFDETGTTVIMIKYLGAENISNGN